VTEQDTRRRQILQAALEVIAERGYADTRIADVAERVDISPALVMYYYKTKDRLLAAATRYAGDVWYDEGTRRLKAVDSATGRLEEIMRLTCLPLTGPGLTGSWAVWLDLWAQALRQDEIGTVRRELDEHWRETIRQVVRDGQDAGEFAAVDPDRFAETFSALLDGLAVQIALDDPVMSPDRCADLAMEYATGALGVDRKAHRSKVDAKRSKGKGKPKGKRS
jgi:AcrR family transcriptional regulator